MQTFSELPLSPQLLRAIQEIGFQTPSPIQQQALPLLLGEKSDFLGLAGTGTGKTAAFAIPLLERINPQVRAVQALVLCPTRELAMQVSGQIDLLGKYKGVRSVTVYGGASYHDQVRGLRQGATIVVGTPGRVIDHIERGTLVLDQVQVLVLDEADEMFSMGFKEELDTILAGVPSEESNTWLFSATMSREVRRIAEENLRSPKTVQVNRTEMLSSGVEQYFYRSQEFEKPDMICKLIEGADSFYGLIFCQTKALVADLTTYLADRGYRVDCLHGDKDQVSRERTMQAFRDRKVQVLVCTDVAARGLDVKDITHVVNYSLPREMESYVHRIGRTARSGKTGIVMNLVTLSHRHLISRIEAHTKVHMKEGFVPTNREIGAKKVSKLLSRFEDQPFHTRVLEVMDSEWKEKLATMSSEEVAAHFIALMMPDVFGGVDSRKTKKASRDQQSAPMPIARPVAQAPSAHVAAAPTVVSKPTVAKTAIETKPEVALNDDETPVKAKPAAIKPAAVKPVARKAPVAPIAPRKFAYNDGPVVFDVKAEKNLRPRPAAHAKPAPRQQRARPSFGPRPLVGKGGMPAFGKPPRKPAAPSNFTKKPKDLAGPARNPNPEGLPEMNRRARRAAKFGNRVAEV